MNMKNLSELGTTIPKLLAGTTIPKLSVFRYGESRKTSKF